MPRPDSSAKTPRWSTQRRLEFIEFRLYWQGRLNRRDLTEQFAISEQQASADIAAYQQLAPGNCEYDRVAKVYAAGPDFAPAFGSSDAQRYLNELRSVDYGISARDESWIGEFPSFATVPYPKRSADASTLRAVLRASSEQAALEVHYQSLSRPEPIWRWITPHALGYDGHRWHTRAFCHRRGDFRDFVLGRIFDIRATSPHDVDPALDLEWAEVIELEIGTHPRLPPEQRIAVEVDHNMVEGKLRLPVRAALAHYLMRWMRVDLNPDTVEPQQIQIVLVNKDAVIGQHAAIRKRATTKIENARVERFRASTDSEAS